MVQLELHIDFDASNDLVRNLHTNQSVHSFNAHNNMSKKLHFMDYKRNQLNE